MATDRQVIRRAELSTCLTYRYLLEHRWTTLPLVVAKILVVCMLNPSTADAGADDATIRWLTGWALRRDYDAMRVVNLAAYRSKSPAAMLRRRDPHGVENSSYLMRYAAGHDVFCGWGAAGPKLPRFDEMIHALRFARLRCVAVTKSGAPGHPLRRSHSLELRGWPVS